MPSAELPADGDRETPATPGAPSLLWLRTFPGEARQVRVVRHWIESILPGCDPRETIVLIASEYATNAIEHTSSGKPGGQFTVHLAWSPATARLTIGDEGSPLPPEAVTANLGSEHGRGLFMVDAMAENWGAANGTAGRLLWADIPWTRQGGPTRISANGAMPTTEAVRRLRQTRPGIQIGYDGNPAAWWSQLPDDNHTDKRITAPCFGALSQMTSLAWTNHPNSLSC